MKTTSSVWRGQPEEMESAEYQDVKIGDVTVFAHQSLQSYDVLEIDLEKSFFSSRLVIRGVPVNSSGCCG